jgi:hypothetical protein
MRIHQVFSRFWCVISLQLSCFGIFLPSSVLAVGATLSWDLAQAADPTIYCIYHRTCHAGSGSTGIGAVNDLSNLIVPPKNLTDSSASRYRLEDLPSGSDPLWEGHYGSQSFYGRDVDSYDFGGPAKAVVVEDNGACSTSADTVRLVK